MTSCENCKYLKTNLQFSFLLRCKKYYTNKVFVPLKGNYSYTNPDIIYVNMGECNHFIKKDSLIKRIANFILGKREELIPELFTVSLKGTLPKIQNHKIVN